MIDTQTDMMQQGGGGYASEALPPDARAALVKKLIADVQDAREFYSKKFEQMRADQRFAEGKQWESLHPELSSEQFYTANIVQRHIAQRTAALYAKNPRVVARRRDVIDYTVWDGKADTISKIQESAMMTGGQVPPAQMAVLADFQRVMVRREMLNRVAKTMEVAYKYFVNEQVVPFKKQMKRVVRRAITTGVGYVKLDFQRVTQMRPEIERQIADVVGELAKLERLAREMESGDIDEFSAEYERLKLMMQKLQMEPGIVAREGLVFDWPASTAIIPDRKCRNLDGFVGSDWVAQEYFLTASEIKEVYDVDIKNEFRGYVPIHPGTQVFRPSDSSEDQRNPCETVACVYVVYHKRDGLVYSVCEGYSDFLTEPSPPNIKLERFFPIFAVMFNECDSEESIFPPSDVQLIKHQQWEYNRSGQALREHRTANRPKTFVAAGRLTEEDKEKLQVHPAHAVIELEGLQPGDDVRKLLQPHEPGTLDPTLYTTDFAFNDVLRVIGTQEANLGGTSNATATETSIAESSRLSSLQSNVDDLDELLTELARCGGQVLLAEVSQKTITEIAGAGAVWPALSRDDIAKELYLEIEAGSSGRPNQAQQIQNFERVAPFLLQIPGIKPARLASEALLRMDDKLDVADFFDPALPSITAMNAARPSPQGGDPESDPSNQGDEGAQNSPRPSETPGDTPGPGRPPMDPNLDGSSGMAVN